MHLLVTPLRFTFTTHDSITFPPSAGNTFRGAIGIVLRRLAPPEIYTSVFEPRRNEPTLSGFTNQPRPFVLRAATLNGETFEPGQTFTLEVLTFDPAGPTAAWLPRVFAALADEGLGPERARLNLSSTQHLPDLSIDLNPQKSAPVTQLQIQFLTPTELKHHGNILRNPIFEAVFTRARDRISALCKLYQGGSPEADYQLLGALSQTIQTTSSRIAQSDLTRRSSRTGQEHQLGGFIGDATYSGDLTPFLPWLEAAQWTGIGRYTTWGNGRIQITAA